MKYVNFPEEISDNDLQKVGGKGFNLAKMLRAGFPVPECFFVNVDAYHRFLEANELLDKILKRISQIDFKDINSLTQASNEIKAWIIQAPMPEDVKDEIIEAYRKLAKGEVANVDVGMVSSFRDDLFVAVRSSAVTEDIGKASAAGQQETFLNIKGALNVVEAVKRCWASLFTPRAIYYREQKHLPHDAGMGVVVQKMVNSEKSGVMFTINPAKPKETNVIVIEAVWGLGETIVQGEVTPDTYMVDKESGKILEKKIGKKLWERVRDPSGKTIKRDVVPERVEAQVLSDEEIVAVAAYGKKLEEYYGRPQDIEFALERGKIYIVQARPVTFLAEDVEAKHEVKASKGKVLVKGMGVSPGIATGKVKIIHDLSELGKIEEGDILVTEMTSPDYVPAMEKSAAIVTDRGGATCFTGDTLILTTNGLMKIKEICEKLENGEEVKVASLNPETLKVEWKRAKNPVKRKASVWKVSFSQTGRVKDNYLEITPDHKMFVFEKREVSEKKIEEILSSREGVCIACKIPQGNPSSISAPELSYLSGVIFTDGYIQLSSRRGRVVFTQKFEENKAEMIANVIRFFREVFDVEMKKRKKKSSGGIIRGKYVKPSTATDFIVTKKNVAEKFLKIKENLENFVLHLDEHSLLNFVAGVIDGDGSFNQNRIQVYIGNENLLKAFVLALLRLGISHEVTKNRNIWNVQIVDGLEEILKYTKRIKGKVKKRKTSVRLFSAKNLLEDIVEKVNLDGRIRPYVENNLLIGENALKKILCKFRIKELEKILNSDLKMYRCVKIEELGEREVYNFEVEENHTYLVFTSRLTPVVVYNCHAAIVSRELGIPCIVGTENATKVLKDGMLVTVDADQGVVYEGRVEIEEKKEISIPSGGVAIGEIITATKVKVNLAFPETATQEVASKADGVGLLRIEHMLTKAGMHPIEYIRQGRQEELIKILEDGIGKVAEVFFPKPVWVRSLDARTDEFRHMQGGEKEPEEDNPMLGWHGIRRSVVEKEILLCEFEAIKRLHARGLTNVHVMLPFIITVEELRKAKIIAKQAGLPKTVKIGIMVETPAASLTIEDFCEEGIDFISFGTNDLTQLTLGVDRNNEHLAELFNPFHAAVLKQLRYVIDVCKEYGVETSICGEAGSNPKMAEILVEMGISSISANIDALDEIRKTVARKEKEILLNAAKKVLEKEEK